jgi:hypothetical protein
VPVGGGREKLGNSDRMMGIRVKENIMYHRHEGRGQFQQWVGGIVLLATVLFASAIPGHTRSGGHGFRGGHGFHGGHGWEGRGHATMKALDVQAFQELAVPGST